MPHAPSSDSLPCPTPELVSHFYPLLPLLPSISCVFVCSPSKLDSLPSVMVGLKMKSEEWEKLLEFFAEDFVFGREPECVLFILELALSCSSPGTTAYLPLINVSCASMRTSCEGRPTLMLFSKVILRYFVFIYFWDLQLGMNLHQDDRT